MYRVFKLKRTQTVCPEYEAENLISGQWEKHDKFLVKMQLESIPKAKLEAHLRAQSEIVSNN